MDADVPSDRWDKISPILQRELREPSGYILQAAEEAYVTIELRPNVDTREFSNLLVERHGGRLMWVSTTAPLISLFLPKSEVLPVAAYAEVALAWHTPHVRTQHDPPTNRGLLTRLGFAPADLEALEESARITIPMVRNVLGLPDGVGRPVSVGIIDSGLDPSMAGSADYSMSLVDDEPFSDESSHGSAVASAVLGINPDARLHIMKTFRHNEGDIAHAMQAMEHLAVKGVKIVNCSYGAETYPPVDNLVDALSQQFGTIFVCAAGNSGGFGTIMSPAASPSALAVGSVALSSPAPFALSSFSSRGPAYNGVVKPDVASFGGGDHECVVLARRGGLGCWKGTSFSTPIVAGLLSLRYAGGPRDALSALVATRVGHAGKDNLTGYGVPLFDAPATPFVVPPPEISKMDTTLLAAGAAALFFLLIGWSRSQSKAA